MFRLFRMMRLEGRYLEAFTLFDDVLVNNAQILGVTGFVGCDVDYCCGPVLPGGAKEQRHDILPCAMRYLGKGKCLYDHFGRVVSESCGCKKGQCYNLFESMLSSMYFTLVNLFGEFPLADNHSGWGRVVGSFTAIIAVAVFGIPAAFLAMVRRTTSRKKRSEEKDGGTRTHTKCGHDDESCNSFGGI